MALLLLTLSTLLAAPPGLAGDDKVITVHHEPPGESPLLGPAHAAVTIEFFCDPGDGGASLAMHELLTQLAARHPRRLRVIYRLVSSSAKSNHAIEAGREAFAQGRFLELMGELSRSRRATSGEELAGAAARAGLDVERLTRAIDEERHSEEAARDHHHRRRHRVRTVPGLLVNGVPLPARQARGLDELEAAYAQAYARARALLDENGVPLTELYPRLLRDVLAAQPIPEIGGGSVDGTRDRGRRRAGPPPLIWGADVTGPHSRGAEDAEVVLIFFCSFQTRNCQSMHRVVEELRAAYPEELRVLFKHLFDDEDRGQPSARRLHEASMCAHDQGAFWPFYDAVYRRHQRRSVTDEYIRRLAEQAALEVGRFTRCLDSGAMTEAVQEQLALSHRLGVTMTPSFVIGGRLYVGTKSFDELRSLVDQELAPGLLGRLAP